MNAISILNDALKGKRLVLWTWKPTFEGKVVIGAERFSKAKDLDPQERILHTIESVVECNQSEINVNGAEFTIITTEGKRIPAYVDSKFEIEN